MLTEIVARASEITGGEDGWANLPGYNENKSKKAFLADEVVRLTSEGALRWSVAGSKTVAFCNIPSWTLVVVKTSQLGGRYAGGVVDTYRLTVFHDGQDVLSLDDRCDNPTYDTFAPRVPTMDIYDVAVDGKKRRPRTAHVCGMHGFGQSMDDSCPACEEERSRRHATA